MSRSGRLRDLAVESSRSGMAVLIALGVIAWAIGREARGSWTVRLRRYGLIDEP